MSYFVCRLFGHRLYADPYDTEVCHCTRTLGCALPFVWIGGEWRVIPTEITYTTVRGD